MKWIVFPDQASCNTVITKINTKFGWRTGQRTTTYAKPTRHKNFPADTRVAIPISDRVADQLTAQQASRLVDISQLVADGWFQTAPEPVLSRRRVSFQEAYGKKIAAGLVTAAAVGLGLCYLLI